MKKIFLSFFIITSVVLLSACGNNTKNENINVNVNENTNINETQNQTAGTLVTKIKGKPTLTFGAGPETKILSEKKENNITIRTIEKSIEDKKIICSEQIKQENPKTLSIRRTCDNGEKSINIIKLINNKRYLRTYTVFSDGRKEKNEYIFEFEQ